MVSFPNAKINLGLNVISKRPDGYHNLDSCFYPVPWTDILEIIPSEKLAFTSSGIIIPGNPEDNLCLKAYDLLKQDFDIPPVLIHLHKIIPIGAGLGGGSSDAAFLLKMLNEKFELGINNEILKNYAAKLGSDCSFFIENKPVIVSGTGTELSSIEIDLSGKYLSIIMPDVHISTTEAYANIKVETPITSVETIIKSTTIANWKELLINDFEKSIIVNNPEIEEAKNLLYKEGATYASMTGSGAAVYGIFDKETDIKLNANWIKFSCQL